MRAHYHAPVQDAQGNLLPGSVITLYLNGTQTLFTGSVYSDATTGTLLPNPFTTTDGNISFYLDSSQRLDLGIAPPGSTQVIFPDIDVETPVSGSANLSSISGSKITNSVFLGAGYQLTQTGFFFYQGAP